MRALEAAKRARAEAEARAEEARGWDADGAGLDARGRRLLQESRSMAAELQLHISVGTPMLIKIGNLTSAPPFSQARRLQGLLLCCRFPGRSEVVVC